MKYIVSILLALPVIFIACKKTDSTTGNVLFYNSTWSLPALSAAWNGATITMDSLAQGEASGTATMPYLPVMAGTNLITIKAGATVLLNKNIYAAPASNSSFIFFDSSTSASPVRILQLTDDLSLPDTAKIKYRILNMAPDTSLKVDVWLVNGATDSIRLDSANTFAGSSALASTVQAFDSVSYHGEAYTLKLKKTATEEVYATVANYPFTVKGIYSIIFSGLLTGTGSSGLKLSVLQHRVP